MEIMLAATCDAASSSSAAAERFQARQRTLLALVPDEERAELSRGGVVGEHSVATVLDAQSEISARLHELALHLRGAVGSVRQHQLQQHEHYALAAARSPSPSRSPFGASRVSTRRAAAVEQRTHQLSSLEQIGVDLAKTARRLENAWN